MKVLSFDVGIKNLGCCIVEWVDSQEKKNNLKIHYWDIINLVENKKQDEHINYKCVNQNCDNKVKSYIEFNDIKYYFCNRHLAKKEELLKNIIMPFEETKWNKIKNSSCNKCKDISSDLNRKTYYQNTDVNLILCSKHYNQIISKVTNIFKKIYPIKNKKVKDLTTNDLKFQLVKCLDQRKEYFLHDIDMVLIENQPTLKNMTMKAVSDTIYTWFMIRGIADKEINNASIGQIKFISPSNKLKEFDQKSITEADESKKYKMTKKLSIQNTKTILTSYGLDNWVKHITSFEKQDDLADSFLQGWYVLNNNNSDKLYNEWQELYNSNILKVKENVEQKIKNNIENLENVVLDLREIIDVPVEEKIKNVEQKTENKTEKFDINEITKVSKGKNKKSKKENNIIDVPIEEKIKNNIM